MGHQNKEELSAERCFSLLILSTPLALALHQAPGIPLERQLPVESRQGEEECNFEPYNQECKETETRCDAGYDSNHCDRGNYCIPEEYEHEYEYEGYCPGVCGEICNSETEDWCDEGYDSNGCWTGNWCQDKSEGGCQHVVSRHGSFSPSRDNWLRATGFWLRASGHGLSKGAGKMGKAHLTLG